MNEIDQLTLKLLTSKKRYNNYLATANPDKSVEIEEYKNKVKKNVPRIKKLIGKYLEDPETQTNNEIDDMLESCFKTLIKHFEMQDYEEKCAKHNYDATDSSEEEESVFKENKKEESGPSFLNKKMEQIFFEKRAIYLWGVVDDKSAKDIVTKLLLLEADKPGADIKFYINSPGGVVTSGMVMFDTMNLIKSPVHTICMGLAASMGSILLSMGEKGKRTIFPHGEVMIHQPSIGGYFQATSADIEIQAEQIRKTKELGAKILADNCGKSVDQIMADFDRDYWMDAKESVEYGIVDGLLDKL